jgi:hypothetical protein
MLGNHPQRHGEGGHIQAMCSVYPIVLPEIA